MKSSLPQLMVRSSRELIIPDAPGGLHETAIRLHLLPQAPLSYAQGKMKTKRDFALLDATYGPCFFGRHTARQERADVMAAIYSLGGDPAPSMSRFHFAIVPHETYGWGAYIFGRNPTYAQQGDEQFSRIEGKGNMAIEARPDLSQSVAEEKGLNLLLLNEETKLFVVSPKLKLVNPEKGVPPPQTVGGDDIVRNIVAGEEGGWARYAIIFTIRPL